MTRDGKPVMFSLDEATWINLRAVSNVEQPLSGGWSTVGMCDGTEYRVHPARIDDLIARWKRCAAPWHERLVGWFLGR